MGDTEEQQPGPEWDPRQVTIEQAKELRRSILQRIDEIEAAHIYVQQKVHEGLRIKNTGQARIAAGIAEPDEAREVFRVQRTLAQLVQKGQLLELEHRFHNIRLQMLDVQFPFATVAVPDSF